MHTLANEPHLRDIGVIGLVPNRWGRIWQPRHHVLARLSRYFHVVWCNPPPTRRNVWSRLSRADLSPDLDGLGGGLAVYQPNKFLVQFGRPRFLERWMMQLWLRQARKLLVARGCKTIILYIWRPQYEPALDLIDHDLSCYHIDDEYTFSEVETPIPEREARLIRRVDQVFIHSPALWKKKGKINPNTAYVSNGVDFEAYAMPHQEPADLRAISHPRIGYIGMIKKQLDFGLLQGLARRHAEWSFVFVGPTNLRGASGQWVDELRQLPNVYFLGPKPASALPAYTQNLDVCMLCYRVNDYTKYIYPMKLHEYLASGRAVVGSPIQSLTKFAHVVKLAGSLDEWSRALEESLAPAARSEKRIRERREVSRKYDWNILVHSIARTFCARLGLEYLDRFERSNESEGFAEAPPAGCMDQAPL